MSILKLDYQGLPVHANREAWFNATWIAEQHGKRLDNFFRPQQPDHRTTAHASAAGSEECRVVHDGQARA